MLLARMRLSGTKDGAQGRSGHVLGRPARMIVTMGTKGMPVVMVLVGAWDALLLTSGNNERAQGNWRFVCAG